jgi:hypothetical protein
MGYLVGVLLLAAMIAGTVYAFMNNRGVNDSQIPGRDYGGFH